MKALMIGLALCAFSATTFAAEPTAAPAPEAGMTAPATGDAATAPATTPEKEHPKKGGKGKAKKGHSEGK